MPDELDSLIEGLGGVVANLESDDEIANNIIAAGAVYMALLQSYRVLDPEPIGYPTPGATNVIEFGLDFMKSRYRATITRVTD